MTCPTCVTNIESFVEQLPGIDRVDVNYAAERVTVTSGQLIQHVDARHPVLDPLEVAVESAFCVAVLLEDARLASGSLATP